MERKNSINPKDCTIMEPLEIKSILEIYPDPEREKILFAYNLAKNALDGKLRENNRPFLDHPLGVAHIVAKELGLDSDSVVTVFLHETLRFHPDVIKDIDSPYLTPEIRLMAESLNKIAAIKPKDTRLEAEAYKKLIVSYSKDPRVTIIKLADRLDVMRHISLMPKSSQERKVAETIMLYIPIAHQLGLYKIKSELEDIFFKTSDVLNYRQVTNKLNATKKDRERMAAEFMQPLKENLSKIIPSFTIKARTKTAYSIWKKMLKQNVPFEGVHDVFAIRIIIDCPLDQEKELCWGAYSIVTNEYSPDTSRLRDWITLPKKNGYESLHTTVTNSKGIDVEVQIRTKRMDDVAENGLASHWSYKGLKAENGITAWLQSVREVLESDEKNKYEQSSQFVRDEVFTFTPDGELRILRAGACVLDFAFNIHSNLGLKCAGAKIDGKVVSIKEKLQTGNVVEIMSNKNQKPSADWLNFVVTTKARAKIKQKIKEEENKSALLGKEILERKLKNWKMEICDEDIGNLCKKYKCDTINQFFSLIEAEKIDTLEIKEFIKHKVNGCSCENEDIPCNEKDKSKCSSKKDNTDYLLIDGKINNIDFKMAKCCNPIFGDDVFGFVSIKDGIKIHRITCPNAARLIKNYPYRIQKVKWKEDAKTSGFQATIKVIAEDASAYASVINIINELNTPIRSSSMQERETRDRGFNIRIQISVTSNTHLDKVISNLKRIKGVSTVLRV